MAADLDAIKAILKIRGYDALVALRGHAPCEEPVAARAALGGCEIRLVFQPKGGAATANGHPPGQFFSPLEALIYSTLGDGRSRIGKRLAAECHQRFGAKFRTILANLIERGVLAHDGQGYRRCNGRAC
jgi:hypothetical protein